MNKSIKAVTVSGKHIVFSDGADLSVYPAEAIRSFDFTYEPADTGALIRISDEIMDYNLRRDAQGNYSPVAYRLAYATSFVSVVASKIAYVKDGTPVEVGRDEKTATLDRKAVEALPADVILAFVQATDPTAINDGDIDAVKKLRLEPAPANEDASA